MRYFYGFSAILAVSLILLFNSIGSIDSRTALAGANLNQAHPWIAFSSYRNGQGPAIYLMAPDGSDVHRLTDTRNNDFPVWSPDGNMIAFETLRDGHSQIYVMHPDGTNPVNLSNNALYEDSPSWTPDGKHVVFESAADEYSQPTFYIMAADGSNRHSIDGDLPMGAAGPVLSPDGKQIAFSSRFGGNTIYIMDSGGKHVRKLVDGQLGPAWSPDSQFIASYGNLANISQAIYITDVSTGENRYLINASVLASSPSWSPSGKQIVFSATQGQSKAQIYVMNSDGSQQVNISSNDFYEDHPSWSPMPVTFNTFPMDLTLVPTALPSVTEPCNCPENYVTLDSQHSTLFAQASAIVGTATAQARETTPPRTPYTRGQLDTTQTAVRGTLFAERTGFFATLTATASSR